MIDNKREVLAVLIGLAAMFAFGRYSVNDPSITIKKSIDKQVQTEEHKNVQTHTTTTTTKLPTGAVTTTTVTDTTLVDSKNRDSSSQTQVVSTSTPQSKSKVSVSALAATQLSNGLTPIYGISTQKEFIGPITLGAFGLTNGVVGISIGINF